MTSPSAFGTSANAALEPVTRHSHNDEYEYQYDDKQTETYLLDLDLSSVNNGAKSTQKKNNPKRRAPKSSTKKKSGGSYASDDNGSADNVDHRSPEQDAAQSAVTNAVLDKETDQPECELQILDLASSNPIVSYKDQLYSCSWTDMIGTNMFFSQPLEAHPGQSLLSNADFDLIGTSRIKLVGQKAKMVPKPPGRKRDRPADETEEGWKGTTDASDAASFPGFASSHRNTNIERRKQANFLDRLMQAKRTRGETDMVPTLGDHRSSTVNRSDMSNLSPEERLRIRNLNDRVVKGDARAVTSLKEMYSQLYGGVSGPNSNPEDAVRIPTPDPAEDDQQPNEHGRYSGG